MKQGQGEDMVRTGTWTWSRDKTWMMVKAERRKAGKGRVGGGKMGARSGERGRGGGRSKGRMEEYTV